MALVFDRCDLLTTLLEKGADDLASTWSNNYLPVHLAAWNGCLRCLKVLVERHPESLSEQTTSATNDHTGNALILDSWAHECESTSCKVRTNLHNFLTISFFETHSGKHSVYMLMCSLFFMKSGLAS